MTGSDWIEAFARHLGVPPPDGETVEALLALAATAAQLAAGLDPGLDPGR